MVGPFNDHVMVFTGLLQALATSRLASRWSKVSLVFMVVWAHNLLDCRCTFYQKTLPMLFQTMPIAAGIGFGISLLVLWLTAARRHRSIYLKLI